MSKPADAQELVTDFVRGLRPWRDLEQVGLTVSFMDDGCDCEGSGSVVVTPSVQHVAEGLERMSSSTEVEFRRWASVLLAASAVVDFAALEEHPQGETLLEVLWDASSGISPNQSTAALIRSLAAHRKD